jgi:outer membrane protein OmpA-like peptidoglycan-associated protein
MKRIISIYTLLYIACIGLYAASVDGGNVDIKNVKVVRSRETLTVRADMVLDNLKLKSNKLLVLTPVVEDKEGHIATLRPLMLTGRNQHFVFLRSGNKNYPDAVEVQRSNGKAQTVSYNESIGYEPWMKANDATVRFSVDTCGCGNLIGQDAGTPREYNIDVRKRMKCPYVMPKATAAPEQFIEGAAYVTYELDSITLKPHLFNNPVELAKIYNDIYKVTNDSLLTITTVSIHGFASPEGRYDHNTYLARERAKSLLSWVKAESNRNGVKVGQFKSDYTSENWEGLIDSLKNNPQLSHRDEIMQIAQSNMEPDAREAEIKKRYPEEYRFMLKNWYPYLRHADYKVGFRLGQVSVDQIKELVKTRPQVLSLNQMYLAAQTYEPGSDEFNEVFDVAVRMYPADAIANLNAACALLYSGNTEKAAEYLEQAGESAEAVNARGVLALQEERYDEAKALFMQASEMGLASADDNLKLLEEMQ